MNMKVVNKVATQIVVAGVKSLTIGAGLTVLGTLSEGGIKGIKELNLDKLLKE